MDNYEVSRDRAQAFFLSFDQEMIIRTWNLKHDENCMYVDFVGRSYAVCRKTGAVVRLFDGKQAGFAEVLSIFDLLCHPGEHKRLSGNFAPVNSLKGSPPAGGVNTNFHQDTARRFDRDPEGLRRACLALGGVAVDMADVGFQFPLFADITVLLKFYHSDEDFPASITLLWDANTLQFIYYETVFYIAGFLLGSIQQIMDQQQ